MTDDHHDVDLTSLGPRVDGGDMAKITAAILFGSAVLARYEGSLVSVRTNPEVDEPDVVCWDGSSRSGGHDVIWVWRVQPQHGSHNWSPPLEQQIRMAELDVLAHGRTAVPGPPVPGTPAGVNIAIPSQVVLVESPAPGTVTFESFECDKKSPAGTRFKKTSDEATYAVSDAADLVSASRQASGR
ncbi:hypothetical protein F4553_001926 [Allocatelliglobosispora scoriae]|uniref:Uncharacterized protein n=1 Tax=Allocatelliglobosispora scoriae TaxID=643052 RepID=A0A841BHH8_9ACTN|nr:hypothetical protein [Allocatelliglobosispora scoriae]MBB5868547.1 hypothetical protein [Allocatelliglobosispora scoriae]